MTQLENDLRLALKVQEQQFSRELTAISRQYETSLKEIKASYSRALKEQEALIAWQIQTLEEYSQASKNVRIELEEAPLLQLQQQVMNLKNSVTNLHERLEESEKQNSVLTEQLNSLSKKL